MSAAAQTTNTPTASKGAGGVSDPVVYYNPYANAGRGSAVHALGCRWLAGWFAKNGDSAREDYREVPLSSVPHPHKCSHCGEQLP